MMCAEYLGPQSTAVGRSRTSFPSRGLVTSQAFLAGLDELRPQYERALATDDVGTKAIWAGEVADLIKDVQPARSIVEATLKGYADTVAKLGRTL